MTSLTQHSTAPSEASIEQQLPSPPPPNSHDSNLNLTHTNSTTSSTATITQFKSLSLEREGVKREGVERERRSGSETSESNSSTSTSSSATSATMESGHSNSGGGGGGEKCTCGNKVLVEVNESTSTTIEGSRTENTKKEDKKVGSGIMKEELEREGIKKLGESLSLGNSGSNMVKVVKEFDRFGIPTASQLLAASECKVVGESGQSIKFSELIHQRGRVVVVFLRHLWCGLCQQYVTALQSLSSSLPTSSTSTAQIPPIYILLISSGSPSLIPIYRKRINCPFPLYVDQSRTLYKALGMTRKSWDAGSSSSTSTSGSSTGGAGGSGGRDYSTSNSGGSNNGSAPSSPSVLDSTNHTSWPGPLTPLTSTTSTTSTPSSPSFSPAFSSSKPHSTTATTATAGEELRTISSYAAGGLIKNVRESIGSAVVMSFKSGGANPGSQRQLGGEFVLESRDGGERIECTYASRMSNTRNHSEVRDLFSAAGVDLGPLAFDQEED